MAISVVIRNYAKAVLQTGFIIEKIILLKKTDISFAMVLQLHPMSNLSENTGSEIETVHFKLQYHMGQCIQEWTK